VRERFGQLGEELYGGLVDSLAKESVRQERLGIPPERVAAAIEHALTSRRPRHRYVIGKDAQATVRVVRHLPSGVVDRVVSRMLG
jgi:hypothetical protein